MPNTGEYGFAWGAMAVDRLAAIPGKGKVIAVAPTEEARAGWTTWTELQVFMSEKGRRIEVWRRWLRRRPDGRLECTKTEKLEANP